MAKFRPTMPPDVPDHGKLTVGQVAGAWRHRMGVGMGGDERRVADRGDVVEALFVQVRQVDHDLELVALADQRLAGIGQAGAGVGVAGIAERHAVAEDGRAAPDRAERAQAGGVPDVQRVKIGADRLGAFHMHDRR